MDCKKFISLNQAHNFSEPQQTKMRDRRFKTRKNKYFRKYDKLSKDYMKQKIDKYNYKRLNNFNSSHWFLIIIINNHFYSLSSLQYLQIRFKYIYAKVRFLCSLEEISKSTMQIIYHKFILY